MRRALWALAAALLGLSATTASAQDLAADARAWAAHDARLMTLSWRLMRANAPFCPRTAKAVGLMLTDFHRFREPARAAAALGVASGIAVEAVARQSPAEAAGLAAGDEVLTIDGVPVGLANARIPKGQFWHDVLHGQIEAALARAGTVRLTTARAGLSREVVLTGEAVCPARFTLISSGTAAMSEGHVIRIAVQLLVDHPDDNEAATMLAHELAHNIFGHVAENNAAGRNYLTVRRNEREADRLAPWLMANALFDPAAAPRFMARWGPRRSGGAMRSQSHDSWQDREAALRAEAAVVMAERAVRPGQALDWRARLPAIQRN